MTLAPRAPRPAAATAGLALKPSPPAPPTATMCRAATPAGTVKHRSVALELNTAGDAVRLGHAAMEILATLSVPSSVNQMLPSGPAAIAEGVLPTASG
ncbi:MAG: hypothetical protein E6J45_06895 [Chloroflexi bacterium]|nr:MAG: hypothetical protein E6J45_06895 [Chloroflexota bacterium]